MSEETVAKSIFTVLLVNGEKRTHTYEVSLAYKEARKFIKFMVKNIGEALRGGRTTFLYFENPSICYNPDNVLGVEWSVLGAKEFEEAVRKAQKKAVGYIKD